MAIFGPQHILSRDDRETIYELAGLRAYAGALDRSLYIKTVPAALPHVTRDFLDSARLQLRLSDARARHWSAVHLVGSASAGAYLVTTHYPLSAATLIESQTPISARILHRILSSTVAGLLELRSLAHRPHGNLKPSNILLSDERGKGPIVLTDPAPSSASSTPAADARALGQLIYELVLHRPVPDVWPIPLTKEWLALGSSGRRWLRLCAALLHPTPLRQLTSLPRIAGAIRRLGPRPILRPFPVAATLAFLTIALWIWAQGPYHVEPATFSDVVPPGPAPTAPPPKAPQPLAPAPVAPTHTIALVQNIADAAATQFLSSLHSIARQTNGAAANLASTEIGKHPPTVAAWHQLRQSLADDLRAHPAHLSQVQNRSAAWQAALLKLDQQYPLPPATLPSDPIASKIITLTQQRRQELFASTLASLISKSTPPPAPEIDSALSRFKSKSAALQAQSHQFLADLQTIDGLLNAGLAPDEKPSANAQSVNDLLSQWHSDPLFKSEVVQTALQPLLAPLETLSNPASLLQTAASPSTLPGIRLAAWRKLPTPSTTDDLAATLRAAQSLTSTLSSVAQAPRRQKILDEISNDARRHWANFLDRSTRAADIDFALSLRPKDASDDASDLSARTQFNILLHDLRQAVSAEKPSTSTISQLAHRLREAATHLAISDSDSLLAALDHFDHPLSAADFQSLGPLSPNSPSADLIPWKVRFDPESQLVSYSAQVSPEITRDQLDLVFRRIETPAGSPHVFLCTTEVSCGLFLDAVSALDKWRDMSDMLWTYDPRQGDPRPGPHTWEWSRYRRPSQGPRRTIVWLAGQADHYPPQLAVADDSSVLRDANGHPAPLLNPSKRQPMQYVSPRAAIYFARLLGCRLQTPAEWKSAYAQFGCNRPNLRDHTWKIQARWAAGSASASSHYPDAGIFLPSPLRPTSAVWSDQAAGGRRADLDYDDGCLWFVEVFTQTQAVFNHLVGNVAEYAMDDTRMYVIGGSAMSPPSMSPDKELELPDWPDSKGFSDVGLRLAFTAPTHDLSRLKTALSKASYSLSRP